MISTSINFDRKLDGSDVENSPRSTSAGGASTPSTESSPRRDESPENVTAERDARDRQFEAMEAELAECDGEATLPVAGLSASRAGIPKVPEYSPFIVKHTFIDELLKRPESLDGFFSERHVQSCPATRQQTADNDDPLNGWNPALWENDEDGSSDEEEIFNTGSTTFNRQDAIYVRNTFIQALLSRSESLEAFLQERKVQSCPNTARAVEPCEASNEQPAQSEVIRLADEIFGESKDSETLHLNTAMPNEGPAAMAIAPGDLAWGAAALPDGWVNFMQQMGSVACAMRDDTAVSGGQGVGPGMWGVPPPPPTEWAPTAFEFGVIKPPPLPTGELGSEEMPTVGSLLHVTGQCQPCGFFHTKGCTNGARCAFCHLCPGSEVKRRRREKREEFRAAREAALQAAEKDAENLDIMNQDLNTQPSPQ